MSSGTQGTPTHFTRPHPTTGIGVYSPAIVNAVNNDAKSVAQAQAKLTAETNTLKDLNKQKASFTQQLKTATDPFLIITLKGQLAQVQASIDEHTKKQSDAQTQLNTLTSNYNSLLTQISKGTYVLPKSKGSPGGNNTSKTKGSKSKAIYQYNAPMVSSAYITRGVQVNSAGFDKLITDPGKLQDASKNWGTNQGAKGVIQMNRSFADMAPAATNKTNSNIVDPQMYGFKFLYNPTSISMAWGIVEQFSPQFEATNQDKASAISVGLMKSAVTFSLMLNRIGDMAFIDRNGLYTGPSVNTSTLAGVQAASNAPAPSANPYPASVPNEDLQMIYKRGTMYDLDFLFRATGGYSSQYHSTMLNGTTADRGWLQPIPVELHLGDGLRYLVRVSALDVQHMIFNERMVPLLTTVNVTCTRYFDGPEIFQTANSSSVFDLTTTATQAAKASSTALK
jgi:hypothetical protein